MKIQVGEACSNVVGINLSPSSQPVEIGLTDLPKSGGAMTPLPWLLGSDSPEETTIFFIRNNKNKANILSVLFSLYSLWNFFTTQYSKQLNEYDLICIQTQSIEFYGFWVHPSIFLFWNLLTCYTFDSLDTWLHYKELFCQKLQIDDVNLKVYWRTSMIQYIAEVFYYVNYELSIITSNVCQIISVMKR